MNKGNDYERAIKELELKEKAIERRDRRHNLISYDSFDTGEILGEEMIADQGLSLEEIVEERLERKRLLKAMWTALALLPEEEYLLIKNIFLDEKGERGYSRETGIPQKTLNDRVHRILEKLKCFTKRL